MCPQNWLIIRLTKDSPLEVHQPEIIQLLSRHKGFSFSHCSLPCTGGSNIQRLNRNEPLKQQRHDTFFHLLSLSEKICESSSQFSFELPQRNAYWKSKQLHESLKGIGRKLLCEFPKLCSFNAPEYSGGLDHIPRLFVSSRNMQMDAVVSTTFRSTQSIGHQLAVIPRSLQGHCQWSRLHKPR